MTLVLPLPVTPARTCSVRPDRTPSTRAAIACGWSPAGLKGASTRNGVGIGWKLILRRTYVRSSLLPIHGEVAAKPPEGLVSPRKKGVTETGPNFNGRYS